MFSIINNLIGLAVLVGIVMFSGWSWWVSIPLGLIAMTVVTIVLALIKNKVLSTKAVG